MKDKELQLRVDDINAQENFITRLEMTIDLYQDWTNYLNDNYGGPIQFKTKILQGLK